jgi:hypothetical protein
MKLCKNGVDLLGSLQEFLERSGDLFIFVPYVKLDALRYLLAKRNNCRAIFVRWETKDLISGASDLEIYSFCKEKGISLFRNKRLHLKAFISNYESCFLSSSNISGRALNLPATQNYNYELATIVDNLTIEDRLYFSIIEQESTLVTDNIYNQFAEQLPAKRTEFPNESEFDIKVVSPDKDFLISSLPLTRNVDKLYHVYESMSFQNETDLNCITHDLALYNLQFGLPIIDFKIALQTAFFAHPFIRAFLKKVHERNEIYFGEAKSWIQENCSNVPLPRRWELTENTQILYSWIEKLSNGEYAVDKPNYSERLYRNKYL